MPTPNLGLLQEAEGAADWDTALNANFGMLDRGWPLRGVFGQTVNTGEACVVLSGGTIWRHNPNSANIERAQGVAFQVNSVGDTGYVLHAGAIRSCAIWSGFITPGNPVYSSLQSPGFLVRSYEGARFPVGIALGHNAVHVFPGGYHDLPATFTQVTTITASKVGTSDFAMFLGRNGLATRLAVQTQSVNCFKVEFHSQASKVNSARLYETLTTSGFDVGTIFYEDGAPWGLKATDSTSVFAIFGRITVQGSSSIDSGHFGITLEHVRFK